MSKDSNTGSDPDSSADASLLSPWNLPGVDGANEWNTFRVMAAFHVYVHLALLCLVAENSEGRLETAYGHIRTRTPIMTRSSDAFARAHYLGAGLRHECWDDLGPGGRGLVTWLTAILAALDSNPPPEGAILHLLLHRYRQEATRIQRMRPPREIEEALFEISDREVKVTCALLADLDREPGLDGGVRTGRSGVPATAAEVFFARRQAIAEAIMRSSQDGYTITGSGTAERDVCTMIETSSHRLAEIGAFG